MKEQLIGKKNIRLTAQTGMSTLEVLIAFTIITLCVGAVILLNFGNQSIATSLQTGGESISQTQETLESARATSIENYNQVQDCDDTTAKPCSDTADSFYSRKLTISSATQCAKNIKSSTSFYLNHQILTTDFITKLTDTVTALALGGDCSGVSPSGDWSNPEKLNSIDTLPTDLKSTGLDVKNKIVYISTDPSLATDPDFFIFDASNTSETSPPVLTASINTGPGLSSVDVAGSYAYVANDSKNGQLQIIDVSDADNPILITTMNVVPGGTDINTVGAKVFYHNKKIYLGLKKNIYAEFYVINVENPLNPSLQGGYELNSSVNSISVSGDYAYIANPNAEEVTIVDINENSSKFMQRVGGFDAPGGSGNGKSIRIIGNKLYLGRTVGNIEFYILDITDPKNPSILGSNNINSSVKDLVVAGDYAYLATSESGSEFQILDISDNSNPILIGKYNYSSGSTGVDYEDNLIYVSNENEDALIIIKPATQ
ncbi:MAG: hypothetical protein KBD17_01135 [Candidatus Pacebacteria bacterium]|nr:hypothetical protein [Candidatus Paceibacterota bacterium]